MAAPIWREWYVMSGLILQHMSTGVMLACPAVLLPAITGPASDIGATIDEASWFVASYGLTGPIGFLILPALMQKYGRKFTNILLNIITLTGSVIIALAPNVPTLIAGRSIHGIAFGGWYLCCIMVAEYAHPNRRGFFIVFKMAAACIAEMFCHALGLTYLTWRQIVWITATPSVIAIFVTLKWPESPSWLAYKGRYNDCALAFEWLRGDNLTSRKELKQLVLAQKQLKILKSDYSSSFLGSLKAFRSKEFQKPFLVTSVLVVLLQACGGYYLATYVVEIMAKLTGDRSKALYYTLALDGIKAIGILVSSWVVTLFNRRTILFRCGSLSCALLGLICVFSYLDSKGILALKWLTPSVLVVYYVLCCGSVIAVAIISKGEMFPLHYKGVGTCIIGIIISVASMVTLKLTLTMILVLEVHGMFAVYLSICVASLICLYFIMPETKDRTLQDIETDFIDVKLTCNDEEAFGLEMTGKFVESEH